jgi:hypothetical protein
MSRKTLSHGVSEWSKGMCRSQWQIWFFGSEKHGIRFESKLKGNWKRIQWQFDDNWIMKCNVIPRFSHWQPTTMIYWADCTFNILLYMLQ